jgi:hypothetical protein
MTLVRADDKGRVCIRGIKSGEQYVIKEAGTGWFVTPAPEIQVPGEQKRKWSKAEAMKALDKSALRFTRSWEQLKEETR